MTDKEKQAALAAIPGLELHDVLRFFDAKATKADRRAAKRVETGEDLEVDYAITSPTDEGTWVLAWAWVPKKAA